MAATQTMTGVPALPPESWLVRARPSRIEAGIVLLIVVVLVWMGLGGTRAGGLVAPLLAPFLEGATGEGQEVGFGLHLATGILLGGAIWANLILLRLVPFKIQVLIVWVELVLLFGLFITSFDRNLGVWFAPTRDGGTNLSYMITTGAVTTLYVSLISIVIASVIALAAALGKLSRSGPAFAIATFYISFFRGTPLLLQVYLIYLGLPQIGPQFAMDAVPSGIIALSLCYGAYLAEIFRAGIVGVAHGQHDAARALGFTERQTFRLIIFPQAMRLIVPPTGNQFIAMLKDSSLVSVMGVWELTRTAQIIGRRDFTVFEMLIAAALIYWAMSICFELIQSRLEKHYGKGHVR